MTTDTPREIELKLRTTPEAIKRLKGGELLKGHLRTAARASRLSSIYYDTPDHRLAARGIALRVRKTGRRHVQTLKGEPAASGAAADRPEWEVPVSSEKPDLDLLPEPARALAGLVDGQELVPLFATRFRRERMLVEWTAEHGEPALIELALDEGRIESGEAHRPISEIELELKEGLPAALFSLAAALRRDLPLALESEAKAQRGFALATGTPPAVWKPGRLELDRDLEVEGGLEAILRQGLVQWMRNEPAARDGRDPEGVHQMRIAVRRLRSALGLFRRVLAPEVRQRWDDELGWLLDELAPVRDLDVFLAEILAPATSSLDDAGMLAGLRDAVEARRARAYESLRRTLTGERHAGLMFEFAAWIEHRGWRGGGDVDLRLAQHLPLRELAKDELARRYRKVRKAGRGFAELDEGQRHALRIRIKKLRYGVEFVGGLFDGKQPRRFAGKLAGLQDALGHLNDLAVARGLAGEAIGAAAAEREQVALGAGVVIGWHAGRRQLLEPEIVARWKAFKKLARFWR
ncbi:CHAD domain-containing protein [Geminicoccaceae bacterium 1502E]|nr:CHAD domain-containing protein [Geminicoccaceae bacterium 1502E]